MANVKDQKELFWLLWSTNDGEVLRNLYFKTAGYRGLSKVSLKDLVEVTGITGITHQGRMLYEKGQNERMPKIDEELQRDYDFRRRKILNFTNNECILLRRLGSSAETVILNARAK